MANLLLSFRNPCLLYPFGRGDCLTDAWIGEETYETQPAGASLLPNKPVGAIAVFWPLLHLASILEQISFSFMPAEPGMRHCGIRGSPYGSKGKSRSSRPMERAQSRSSHKSSAPRAFTEASGKGT